MVGVMAKDERETRSRSSFLCVTKFCKEPAPAESLYYARSVSFLFAQPGSRHFNIVSITFHLFCPLICMSARLLYPPVSLGMSDAAIMELNLPTGIPIVYELDEHLKPTKPMAFLGDAETVKKAMEAVAAQGKAKK